MNASKRCLILFILAFECLWASYPEAAPTTAEAQTRNPLGCLDKGYQYDLNVLTLNPPYKEDHQFLYFFFNKKPVPIKLYQMINHESTRFVALDQVIRPNEWAALASSQEKLQFICSLHESSTSYGPVVSCADHIKVCEYARAKFGMNNRGNFWVAPSGSRGGAVAQVLHYGIIPM